MLPHWTITRLRRRVFWVFAALYAAMLPALLLFAFGIDLRSARRGSIEETASFTVSTVPPGARVEIQGKAVKLSPAIFDDLHTGTYGFHIASQDALPWTGDVRTRAGLAFSISQLPMVSTRIPREVFSFVSRTPPVPLDGGTQTAYLPPGEEAVFLAHGEGSSVSVIRVSVPDLSTRTGVRLEALEATGQLLARWDGPEGSYAALVRPSRIGPTPGSARAAVRVPSTAIEVLSASAEDGGLVVMETDGIARYAPSGARTALVRFPAPLLACGIVQGRWHAVDRSGNVYQYGNPLQPSLLGRLNLDAYGDLSSPEPMRILTVSGESAGCYSAPRRSFFVFTPGSSVEFRDFDGGCASREGNMAWIWRSGSLYASERDAPPVLRAQCGAAILGIREGFLQRITAVTTEDGVRLLPSVSTGSREVRFDPVRLDLPAPAAAGGAADAAASAGAVAVPWGESVLLVRESGPSPAARYRLMELPQ